MRVPLVTEVLGGVRWGYLRAGFGEAVDRRVEACWEEDAFCLGWLDVVGQKEGGNEEESRVWRDGEGKMAFKKEGRRGEEVR